jgi:hypothetical protein
MLVELFQGQLERWLRFLQEIKVRFVHLEVPVFGFSDEFVVLADLALLLIVFLKLFWVQVCQNFEFSLKLTLFDLMQTFLVVLIAQVVNGNLPSLEQVSCLVTDMLPHTRQVAGVVLQSSRNFALLQVLQLNW